MIFSKKLPKFIIKFLVPFYRRKWKIWQRHYRIFSPLAPSQMKKGNIRWSNPNIYKKLKAEADEKHAQSLTLDKLRILWNNICDISDVPIHYVDVDGLNEIKHAKPSRKTTK